MRARNGLVAAVIVTALAVSSWFGLDMANYFLNNSNISQRNHKRVSFTNGNGHVDYIIYSDGSQEIYHTGLLGESEEFFDNGDGHTDRMVKRAGISGSYRILIVSTRKVCSSEEEGLFRKADEEFRYFMIKYKFKETF